MSTTIKFSYRDDGIQPTRGQSYRAIQETIGPDAARFNQYLDLPFALASEATDCCDEYLQDINDVESGKKDEVSTGINDFSFTITKSGVQVDILINDAWIDNPDGFFPLSTFRSILEGYKQFLNIPFSPNLVTEVVIQD